MHGTADIGDADRAWDVDAVKLDHAGAGGPDGAVRCPAHWTVDVGNGHAAFEHDEDGGAAEGVDVARGGDVGLTAKAVEPEVDSGGGDRGTVEELALRVTVGGEVRRHVGVSVGTAGLVGGASAADCGVAEIVEAEFGEKPEPGLEASVVKLEGGEMVAQVGEGAGGAPGACGAAGVQSRGGGCLAAGGVADVERLVAFAVNGDGDAVEEDRRDFGGSAPEVHVEGDYGQDGKEGKA